MRSGRCRSSDVFNFIEGLVKHLADYLINTIFFMLIYIICDVVYFYLSLPTFDPVQHRS